MPTLQEIESETLFERIHQEGNSPAEVAKAKEQLLMRFLPLIRPIAVHLAGARPDLIDDLSQVGAIGLLRAIERFDSRLGKAFEPYAKALVSGEMRHYMRDAVPLVRPPRELVEMRSRVTAARHALEAASEEPATAPAIAELAELPVEKVEEVLALEENFCPASLDQELETEGGAMRYQLVDSRYKSFQLAAEDRFVVQQALADLRAVSREVIEFAFYEDLTQTEIAKKLGISQMQVSRRLKTATGELWKVMNTKLF